MEEEHRQADIVPVSHCSKWQMGIFSDKSKERVFTGEGWCQVHKTPEKLM